LHTYFPEVQTLLRFEIVFSPTPACYVEV